MKNILGLSIVALALGVVSCSTGSDTQIYNVTVSVQPSAVGTVSPAAEHV